MTLREAVTKAVSSRSLTRREILQEVQNLGYRFKSKNPGKSLDVFLYGTGKHLFNRVDGKFALLAGSTSGADAKKGNAKPVRAKRKMSAAARAKISAAAKARWARVKAGK